MAPPAAKLLALPVLLLGLFTATAFAQKEPDYHDTARYTTDLNHPGLTVLKSALGGYYDAPIAWVPIKPGCPECKFLADEYNNLANELMGVRFDMLSLRVEEESLRKQLKERKSEDKETEAKLTAMILRIKPRLRSGEKQSAPGRKAPDGQAQEAWKGASGLQRPLPEDKHRGCPGRLPPDCKNIGSLRSALRRRQARRDEGVAPSLPLEGAVQGGLLPLRQAGGAAERAEGEGAVGPVRHRTRKKGIRA